MLLGYILILIFIFIDQLTKIVIYNISNANPNFSRVIIPNVFELHYVINEGASFGILSNMQFLFAIITIIALIIFGFLFFEINFKTKKTFSIGIILIIAGTFGNAIDRLFRSGGVIDMINMPILNDFLSKIGISAFVFNVADFYMNLGIFLFFIDFIFFEKLRKGEKNEIQETIN